MSIQFIGHHSGINEPILPNFANIKTPDTKHKYPKSGTGRLHFNVLLAKS